MRPAPPPPAWVDANIIIRFLTGEPDEQAERAARLFEAVDQGIVSLRLEDVVLAEVVWTLSSYYRMTKAEIASALLELLAAEGLQNPDKPALQVALILFRDRNLDFADALLAARILDARQAQLYSFDRDFDRVPGVRRREPG